jgi:hypothetical protein
MPEESEERDPGFSEAQKAVIEKCHELLSEHFDAHILAVTSDCDGEEGDHSMGSTWRYGGGLPAAIGQLRMMEQDLMQSRMQYVEDDSSEGEE